MSCTSFIKRHINLVPVGIMFTTRDCLKYGTRGAVDKALKRFVDDGTIFRLTGGVFMRLGAKIPMPSPISVARVKARAFGKDLVEHGADLACERGLIPEGNDQPTFFINGGSSSFMYGGIKIHLRSASKKRMQMKDAPIGQAVRALWHLGAQACTSKLANQAVCQIANPDVRRQLVLSKAWMPAWLAAFFPTVSYPCPQNAPAQSAYFKDYFNPEPRVSESRVLWRGKADKNITARLIAEKNRPDDLHPAYLRENRLWFETRDYLPVMAAK